MSISSVEEDCKGVRNRFEGRSRSRPAELITERSDASPNAAVEVRETLPDGTEFKAVWSYLQQSGVAKLVTVHFFDEGW